MKRILILSLILLSTSAFECISIRISSVKGSGIEKTETRDVAQFSSINVGGSFYVNVTCGKNQSVAVTADDNLLPLISTKVKNNTLYITTKKMRNLSPKTRLRIDITIPNLEKADISGATKVKISDIDNESFRLELSGASEAIIRGKTNSFNAQISGASNLNSKDLIASIVVCEMSGASKASVYVSEKLKSDISGAASLRYYGSPKIIENKVSGAGSVKRKY